MDDAFGSALKSMFDYIFGGGCFDQALKYLHINTVNDTTGPVLRNIEGLYDTVMVPLGFSFVVIWFLVGFIQKSTSEQMTFDQIFLLCVKLIASIYIIQNGFDLFTDLLKFSNDLMDDLSKALGNWDWEEPGDDSFNVSHRRRVWEELTGVEDAYDYPAWYMSLLGIVRLLFPWIFSWIISLCAGFIAFSRILEIFLRATFLPIAVSEFMIDGIHGSGWRYIKSFLAVCLQGGAILVIIHIYYTLVGSYVIDGNATEMIIGFLVISFSALALMFKSLSFCKEVVGA